MKDVHIPLEAYVRIKERHGVCTVRVHTVQYRKYVRHVWPCQTALDYSTFQSHLADFVHLQIHTTMRSTQTCLAPASRQLIKTLQYCIATRIGTSGVRQNSSSFGVITQQKQIYTIFYLLFSLFFCLVFQSNPIAPTSIFNI